MTTWFPVVNQDSDIAAGIAIDPAKFNFSTGTYSIDSSHLTGAIPSVWLGTSGTTAAAGDAAPNLHGSSHEPNGSDAIDWTGKIHRSGLAASRPTAVASNAGALYYSTDTQILSRSDGSTWTQIAQSSLDTIASSRLTGAIPSSWLGTSSSTAAAGNATPNTHATSHAPGGSDALDYTLVNLSGTLTGRPSATSSNNGLFYFATDDSGGTLYRSTGSAWTQIAKGVTAPPNLHASTHGSAGTDPLSAIADSQIAALASSKLTGNIPASWLGKTSTTAAAGTDARFDPYGMFPSAADNRLETFARDGAINTSTVTAGTSTGTLSLTFFKAAYSFSATNVTLFTGITAGANIATAQMAVYSVNSSNQLTGELAHTTNDTTLLTAPNATYTKALSGTVSFVEGTRYAVGLLVILSSGSTVPSLRGFTHIAGVSTLAPFICGLVAAQSALPSSFPVTTTAGAIRAYYNFT